MTNERVTVVARVRAKAGLEEVVKFALLQMVADTREEEGCLNYDLHQSADDPALFLFYENWTNREHLQRHAASPHIQAFRAKAADLLAEPTEITLWNMIS